MTCAECGKDATFWLCSNACALAYAKKRAGVDCAICSYDPKTGRVGKHNTSRICAGCRARAENVDWVTARKELPDKDIDKRDDALGTMREQQDRPLPKITAKHTRVAKLLLRGSRARVVVETDGVRTKRRRWRGLTEREIAARAGCSKRFVAEFIRHLGK